MSKRQEVKQLARDAMQVTLRIRQVIQGAGAEAFELEQGDFDSLDASSLRLRSAADKIDKLIVMLHNKKLS